jgi:hypothetical protein
MKLKRRSFLKVSAVGVAASRMVFPKDIFAQAG